MRAAPWIAAALCLLATGAHAADTRPVLAVFNVEGKRIKLDRDLADALADHASTLLTETGRYQVVPRDQLKQRLTKQKTASYKACYDQTCQIEVGKELAAEKSLAIQVIKIGSSCTVNATLYDLRKSTTEKAAASPKGGCGEDALLTSLEQAIHKLAPAADAPVPVARPEPEPEPEPVRPVQPLQPPAVVARSAAPEVEMVSVPAGPFWMGCNRGVDSECNEDELPGHRVELSAFAIDKTEVTVEQYMRCVQAGKCSLPTVQVDSSGGYFSMWGMSGQSAQSFNHADPSRVRHPMNGVSWRQARDFCAWAGKRLPTEAEWEKAARGKDFLIYPWGMDTPACERAVMSDDENGEGCGQGATWEVCSRPEGKSPYGACDMAGNVWEWVEDLYGEESYKSHRDRDPRGPRSGSERVLRGGSYAYGPKEMRASHRSRYGEEQGASDIGFRCARSEP